MKNYNASYFKFILKTEDINPKDVFEELDKIYDVAIYWSAQQQGENLTIVEIAKKEKKGE